MWVIIAGSWKGHQQLPSTFLATCLSWTCFTWKQVDKFDVADLYPLFTAQSILKRTAVCEHSYASFWNENYSLKGGFCGKKSFFLFFFCENECLDGMEPVYIYIYIYFFFPEAQLPSDRAFYFLHFWESYLTSIINVVCRDVTRGLLHGDLQQNQ